MSLATLVIDGVENQVEVPLREFAMRGPGVDSWKSEPRVEPSTLVVQSVSPLRFTSNRAEFSIGVRYMTGRGAKTVEVRSIDGVATLDGIFAAVDGFGLEISVAPERDRPRVWVNATLRNDDEVHRVPQRKYEWTSVTLKDASNDGPVAGAVVYFRCIFGHVEATTDGRGVAYVPVSVQSEDATSPFPIREASAWSWDLAAVHEDFRASLERCAGPQVARPIPRTIKMRRKTAP